MFPSRTSEIPHPETKYPVDHKVNDLGPHENADMFRETVRDMVAGMAARGAFDQDNLEALSHTTDGWLQTWIGLAHQTAVRRREVAEQLLAQSLQYQREVVLELDDLHRRLVEVTAARDELLNQLGFTRDALRTEQPAAPARELPESRIRALRTPPQDQDTPSSGDTPPDEELPMPRIGPSHPSPLPTAGFAASAETTPLIAH
ncbi:hypothetical protein [Microbacterium candidum]|uniref:Uncharacterized protein n=1 Tax=Microbacterium candidum TaxID=3041922 RepID=A0ABT7MW30_9MICO|nr:hypothetical protein [Microbacterium sp. ASV49]MDL9978646.1 hypothetical protein [Microbacterium sp. ASV49]